MTEKPPYRVPLMSEIARIRPCGLRVISTFAGAGGSSLGYRMAGCKVLWASEFIDAAREVYQLNAAPGTIIDGRDIREVDPFEVMRTVGIAPGELDILDGSPPCASFSTAGKREAGWGHVKKYSDKAQRTDDLFFEYIRFIKAMRPKVFVAENVSGLVKGTAKGYFLEILAAMKACGYRVRAQLLDAQWLGVPQARERIIFIGVRDDLGIEPVHPKPLPYRYSVRDALPWIIKQAANAPYGTSAWQSAETNPSQTIGASPSSGNGRSPPSIVIAARDGKSRSLDEPAPTIMSYNRKGTRSEMTIARKIAHAETVDENVAASIEGYALEAEYDKLNPGQASDKFFNLVRADQNAPSPTITAQGTGSTSGAPGGVASVCHPTEKRKFSIAELKRICGFPDDFALTGTYAQQWERMGRAVPPPMMAAIAGEIVKILAPGSSRTRGRPKPSPGRSTTGSSPKGGGKPRRSPPNEGGTRREPPGSRKPGRRSPREAPPAA